MAEKVEMKEETQIKYIERIEIKGLWSKFDIDWELNPDVNILIGVNGSGKTTVLNLVAKFIGGMDLEIRSVNSFLDQSYFQKKSIYSFYLLIKQ